MARYPFLRRSAGADARRASAGFTIIELVTVMVIIGILGAVGASRFFDRGTFAGRAYSDQVNSVLRAAQKMAIAQNRIVFVRVGPTSVAVCFNATCDNAAALAFAPGGSNSGGAATRVACVLGANYVANWLCEGIPANVALAGAGAGGLYFDPLGRPYNIGDAVGASTFIAPLTLTFTSDTASFPVTVEAETGYVH